LTQADKNALTFHHMWLLEWFSFWII